MYTHSPFPRPPGPSPLQSRESLERMLLKSAQLAQSWTTQPLREVSSIKIKNNGPSPPAGLKLIPGRWLVACEDARRFVLHDADPHAKTHARKVLWEHEEQIVLAWDVHSVSPVAGQSVVYVSLFEFGDKWYVCNCPLGHSFREGLPTCVVNHSPGSCWSLG